MSMEHLFITGGLRPDRESYVAEIAPSAFAVSAHQQLRGPYTGIEDALRHVLPDAYRRWPELVEAHRVELLHSMPSLAELVGPPPVMMSTTTPYENRTRFYSRMMLRSVHQGIVTFLRSYGDRLAMETGHGLELAFHDVAHASHAAQEFFAFLIRRCSPDQVRLILSADDTSLSAELAEATHLYTSASRIAGGQPRDRVLAGDELVRDFIAGDCLSDDPAVFEAYQAADPAMVAGLHDERADELEAAGWPAVGAVTFHRERGRDPRNAGVAALLKCLQFGVESGLSPSVIQYAQRGRRLADPETQTKDFANFTMQAGYSLVDVGQLDEGIAMFTELRRRYQIPRIQMMTSYAISMVYTRFQQPRDHEAAAAWQNNALVIARLLPDTDERRVMTGFMENGLALIEMHRKRLDYALELVESALTRLNTELKPGEWLLHRQQLLYNRARLLAVMGRPDDAYADFTTLIEQDPYFVDYLTERAKVSRKAGDLVAAMADYDRAIALSPPFPENFYTRATARLQAGDTAGAIEDLELVLDMEPRDIESRITLVEIHLEQGALDQARDCVLNGLEWDPDNPRLLYLLASTHWENGQPQLALEQLDKALTQDPTLTAALIDRAVIATESGHYASAITDLDQALLQWGDDPDLLLNRGIVYARMNDPGHALENFEAAFKLADADLAELHFYRANARLALGQHEQAKADLAECTRLGSHTSEVETLLETLQTRPEPAALVQQ